MTMVPFSTFYIPRYLYLKVFAVLLILQVETGDAFSSNCPMAVSSAADRMTLSGNSLSPNILKQNVRQCQQHIFALCAVNNGRNNQIQSDADRSYDFIAREEANKMLQQERLKNEQEIRQMKITLKRQHQELLEYDGEAFTIQLANEDDSDLMDLDPEIIYGDIDGDDASNDDSPFAPPFSDNIDEEQFRQHHERSHNTAECRTIEIALQQIHEDNVDLKSEFNDQQNRFQSSIDETRRMICDMRDRYDCIQHELKLEASYFERAKSELEELVDRERSQARELEQQLSLARREQEILEQAAIEAQHRQQELQEREEHELQRQQEQIQLEREELERQQQQIQQEQEEHDRQLQQELMQLEEEQERKQQQQIQKEQEERLRHEELLRNHEELVELEKHQKDFDDVYFNAYNDNNIKEDVNDNTAQSQRQFEQDEGSVNGGQEHSGYENSDDSVYSTHSTHFGQYDVLREQQQHQQHQQWQWQQTYNVAVTTKKHDPRQPKRAPKRDTRTNSQSHGMFMNFNDMLV